MHSKDNGFPIPGNTNYLHSNLSAVIFSKEFEWCVFWVGRPILVRGCYVVVVKTVVGHWVCDMWDLTFTKTPEPPEAIPMLWTAKIPKRDGVTQATGIISYLVNDP